MNAGNDFLPTNINCNRCKERDSISKNNSSVLLVNVLSVPDRTPSASPSPSPSIEPSETPTISPSALPTPTASPTESN